MEIIDTIILGIIQGLSEFLPISSSGHLVVGQKLLNFKSHDVALDIVVHLGTLGSIFTVFRKELITLAVDGAKIFKGQRDTLGARWIFLIILGSIPTAIIGFTLKDYFITLFGNLSAVGIAFLVTGSLLFLTRFKKSKGLVTGFQGVHEISALKAIIIGFAQGLAITPGISRSGTTIAVALLLGVKASPAATFSFLLAIPAVIGAALLELKDVVWTVDKSITMGAGLITSYIFGLIGLKWVMATVSKGRLDLFSYYLWALGLFLLYIA